MSKSRTNQISRLFDLAREPLYILDANQAVIYANPALEEWTGCEAELLIGKRLRYHGPVSRLRQDILMAALCPPPEVTKGRHMKSVLEIDLVHSISRRQAEFVPIQLSPDTFGTIVFVSPDEFSGKVDSESFETRERKEAEELHQMLIAYRRFEAGRFHIERLYGNHPTIKKARLQGRFASESNISVLIIGEPGTGKNHLGSGIHYAAANPGAVIPIDCSVIEPELIKATVLAFRRRYDAENSTRRSSLLLLDPERIPENFVDIFEDFILNAPENQRIIACTSLHPTEWKNGDRLSTLLGTLAIELPSLRERADEIPMLAQLFLEERNAQQEKQLAGFTSDALDRLSEYYWPGNVDELRESVFSAHENAAGTLVSAAELPKRLLFAEDAKTHGTAPPERIELDGFLAQIESELIERAMKAAKGNKSKAAKLLGISRPKLHRKLAGENEQ